MSKGKSKSPKKTKKLTVTQKYEKEYEKALKRIKQLEDEGFTIDEKDRPKYREHPRQSSIEKLKRDFTMRPLRSKAYVTLESGSKVTSREVEQIKRKQQREQKKEQEKSTQQAVSTPSELESLLDSLYDLLDPYYYEKDKKHNSSFTQKAEGIIIEIREVIDNLKDGIQRGEINPSIVSEYVEQMHNIIFNLTRDYRVVEEEYDIAMSELYEIIGTIEYESDEYYAYYDIGEEDDDE